VTHAYERRSAALFGAVSLALADELRVAGRAVAPYGPSGPAALVALDGELGGRTIEALRRALGLTHSGTVRLVDRLAGAGLVERRVGADARSVSLHLTPPGRRAARQVATARDSALERAMTGLTPVQRAQLAGLLERVAGELGVTLD
jgi:DNA-binding MarR family transcriptional regulator